MRATKEAQKQREREQEKIRKQQERERKIAEEFESDKGRILSLAGKILPSSDLTGDLAKFLRGREASLLLLAAKTAPIDAARALLSVRTGYKELQEILDGKSKYDPKAPPFLLKLLQDPATAAFCNEHKARLIELLSDQRIVPLIVPYIFKALKDGSAIKDLEAKGLGSAYIERHLRPAVIEAVKSLLADPARLVQIAGLVLEMQLSTAPTDEKTLTPEAKAALEQERALTKKRLVRAALSAMDMHQIIAALGPLAPVLIEEQHRIGVAASTVIAHTALPQQLPRAVTPDLLGSVVAVAASTAGAALSHPDALASISTQVQAIMIDDSDTRIREAASLQGIIALDAAAAKKKADLVKGVVALGMQPDVLASLAATVPPFLAVHGAALSTVAAKLIPKAVAGFADDAQALAAACRPGIDREAIVETVTPLAVRAMRPFGEEFYASALPSVLDVVTTVLAHPEVIPQAQAVLAQSDAVVAQAPVATPDGEVVPEAETPVAKTDGEDNLDKLLTTAGKILADQKTQAVITTQLPALLRGHAAAIGQSVMTVADAALGKTKLEPFITSDVVSSLIPVAADALPGAYALASECFKDRKRLRSVVQAGLGLIRDDRTAQIRTAASLDEIAKLNDEKAARTTDFVQSVFAFVTEPDVLAVLASTLPPLLAAHGSTLSAVAAELLPKAVAGFADDSQALAAACKPDLDRAAIASILTPLSVVAMRPLGGTFYRDVVPPVLEVVTTVLEHRDIVQQGRAVMKKPDDPVAQVAFFKTAGKILADEKTKEVITTQLPALLLAHEEAISQSVMAVISARSTLRPEIGGAAQSAAKAALGKQKPKPFITLEVVNSLIPVLASALPVVHTLAGHCLADQERFGPVVQLALAIMDAPAKERSAMMPKLIKAILPLADNPEVRKIIESEVPGILETHSAAITGVIDKFIKNTEIGKKLNVQTSMLLGIAAKKVPQLVEVASAYSKGNYATMIARGLRVVLSDRRVLRALVRIGFTVLRHKASNLFRPPHPKKGPAAGMSAL